MPVLSNIFAWISRRLVNAFLAYFLFVPDLKSDYSVRDDGRLDFVSEIGLSNGAVPAAFGDIIDEMSSELERDTKLLGRKRKLTGNLATFLMSYVIASKVQKD